MHMTETRKFKVSPNIIYSLIKAQAGSLGKAITECVMNSVDAFAKKVEITVTSTTISIVDDGIGFQTQEEIEAWFETLGFDHNIEGNHRAFGAFGIGRAQLWAFTPTIWRTNQFMMDVDIKNKGLDYELHEVDNSRTTRGLEIKGTFYKPLTAAELISLEQELRRQIRFVQIPVFMNSMLLGERVADQTWDFETADAWFQFEQGRLSLDVFNMGVFIRSYPYYQFKVGGRVVTKPGVKLELNMARNDVLVADCPVWARISQVLADNETVEKKKTAKAVKLSEAEIAERVRKVVEDGDHTVEALVDIRGRNRSIWSLLRASNIVIIGDGSDLKTKRAHQLKLAVVLKPESLTRFGCENAVELKQVVMKHASKSRWHESVKRLQFFDSLEEGLPTLDDRYEMLASSELTPMEGALLFALNRTKNNVRQHIVDANGLQVPFGTVRAGQSDIAKAWSMGGEIALDRAVLKKATTGFSGFMVAMGYVMHEMAAGLQNSNVEHTHDVAFYEHLQEMMLDPKLIGVILAGYSYFTRQCSSKGIELHRTALEELAELPELS